MQILIKQDALELLFRVALSCRCPFTDCEEQGIYDRLHKIGYDQTIDYNELLEIFKQETNTVIHRLLDFSIWFIPANSEEVVIEKDHVLRHFASSYHWNHVVASGMTNAYKNVISIPKWFIAHMLLPVTIERNSNGDTNGIYNFDGGEIVLKNLFIPPELEVTHTETLCVHFASGLTSLSPNEDSLVRMLIDANSLFTKFRGEVNEIDYLQFERYGDYRAICAERHKKYFGNNTKPS